MYIFNDIDLRRSLFGLAPLCELGCAIHFSNSTATVTYSGKTVLSGKRLPPDLLWAFDLPVTQHITRSSTTFANAAMSISSDAAFVNFAHATLGSPSLSTLLRALKAGYLDSFPRLSATLVTAHPPHTLATAKGHLDQHRQGLDSTDDASHTSHTTIKSDHASDDVSHTVYVKTVLASDTTHSDLTGRLPIPSITGQQYIFISTMDGYIHAETMASRHHTEYLKAYQKTIDFFRSHGHPISVQRLDNETSSQLEKLAQSQKISIQFCPPANHRALHAERSIRTYKNHLIATLATTALDFPLNIWDKLLPQVEICLNHLLPYKPNPNVSAYAGIRGGSFDFRAHPIAPLGTKVLIHDKPANRTSWAPHGVPGFYIGPAQQHYRCYQAWAIPSQSIRISDTLAWFPVHFTMPGLSPLENATAAIIDLATALHYLHSPRSSHTTSAQPSSVGSVVKELQDIIQSYSQSDTHSPSIQRVIEPPLDFPPVQPNVNPDHPILPPPPEPLPPLIQSEQINSPNIAFPDNHNLPCPPRSPEPPSCHTLTHVAHSAMLNLDTGGKPLTYKSAIQGPDRLQWIIAEEEEFDRLFATKTIAPLHSHEQPLDRKKDTTYYNPQVKQKCDAGKTTFRIRGTIGGDRINYPGETSALTAAMPVVKLLLQSAISENMNVMTMDARDYYLNTPLQRPEYLRIPLKFISTGVIEKHKLSPYIHNDSILFSVHKGMYGLPQAGYLAQIQLIQHLRKHGYTQTLTPCLFRHNTNRVAFTLVVDDFLIKYPTQESADHLHSTLSELYEMKCDYSAAKYIGFSIEFNRPLRTVSISMPGYISKVLTRFAPNLTTGADSPALYIPPTYGIKIQSPTADLTPELTPIEKTRIQGIVGSLLFYARGVDPTILPAVNLIASLQARPTQFVAAAAERLLQYCARFQNNSILYRACDMTLHVQSDASYLSRNNARSVAGAIFYMGNKDHAEFINGSVLAISTIIPAVVASAAEAEYAALFIAAQEAVDLRNILDSLGYPQQPTTILCDNLCAVGLASNTVKQRKSKSIDMRFHWLRDRIAQNQFLVKWRKGALNLADFFTKILPVAAHRALMPLLVQSAVTTAQFQKKHNLRLLPPTKQQQIHQVAALQKPTET